MVEALRDLRTGADARAALTTTIPAEVRRRLARPDLDVRGLAPARAGASAVVDIFGRGLDSVTVSLVLHGDGGQVTTALCSAGRRLPEELRVAAAELEEGPFPVADTDGPAADRAATALAWVSHSPEEIPSDHRWWSEISGLVMLAELTNEG